MYVVVGNKRSLVNDRCVIFDIKKKLCDVGKN